MMEDGVNTNNIETINYRLGAIETSINELKQLLIKVPVMSGTLKELSEKVDSNINRFDKTVKSLDTKVDLNVNAINKSITTLETKSESKITDLENKYNKCQNDIEELKSAPAKKDSEKLKLITDLIYKSIITAAIGVVLAKIGFGG